jgi:hypothetical protein
MAEKSSTGTRQTDGKILIWFGEIERKLAKLSRPTFLTVLHLNYFMIQSHHIRLDCVEVKSVFIFAFEFHACTYRKARPMHSTI